MRFSADAGRIFFGLKSGCGTGPVPQALGGCQERTQQEAPAPLAELTRLPDPQFIMVGEGLRVATYSWGELDDPVVVVVHGFASSTKDNWVATGWVRDLLRAGYRVIGLDQRGLVGCDVTSPPEPPTFGHGHRRPKPARQ